MPRYHRRPNDGIEYELLTMSHDPEASRVEEPVTVGKSTAINEETNSKAEVGSLSGIDDVAAIPKGTIDPVYEAKARVLNHAVGFPRSSHVTAILTFSRSKRLEWASITGSSLS
jgi:hypothetical protein